MYGRLSARRAAQGASCHARETTIYSDAGTRETPWQCTQRAIALQALGQAVQQLRQQRGAATS